MRERNLVGLFEASSRAIISSMLKPARWDDLTPTHPIWAVASRAMSSCEWSSGAVADVSIVQQEDGVSFSLDVKVVYYSIPAAHSGFH